MSSSNVTENDVAWRSAATALTARGAAAGMAYALKMMSAQKRSKNEVMTVALKKSVK